MIYTQHYDSPLGGILLSADETGLTGLWFDGAKYFAKGLPQERTDRETPALLQSKQWLDLYFSGAEPDFTPPLHPAGTAFQQALDAKGVCVSVKSACSVENTPSRAVFAVSHDRKTAMSSWRISLSHLTTQQDMDGFLSAFEACYKELTK